MIGDAAHGDALCLIASRKGELELARGYDGVLEEQLVKVAHSKEEQGIGMGLFGGSILSHGWR
jgi:hypothetical protein